MSDHVYRRNSHDQASHRPRIKTRKCSRMELNGGVPEALSKNARSKVNRNIAVLQRLRQQGRLWAAVRKWMNVATTAKRKENHTHQS